MAVVGCTVEVGSDSNVCGGKGMLYHRLFSTFCPKHSSQLTAAVEVLKSGPFGLMDRISSSIGTLLDVHKP
jgi:hypothetical protein